MNNKQTPEILKDFEKEEFVTEKELQRQPQVVGERKNEKVRIWGFKENYKRSRG